MNSFGKNLRITLFGASHEQYIGLVIDGYPAGINIDVALIKMKLQLRRGLGELVSSRLENDDFQIISGYFKNYTTGAPLTVLVKNEDVISGDYEKCLGKARPSHGDYVLHQKYNGFNDYRGGGTSSGRLTVVLVILGALCEQLLKDKNILVGSRVKSLGSITDDEADLSIEEVLRMQDDPFPVRNSDVKAKMLTLIKETKIKQDSLGAIIQTGAFNLPVGLGEPFFNSMESIISHLIFAIPGVKGIEFGSGFKMTQMHGSTVNDSMYYENKQVKFTTNYSGGINAGISNGNPLLFQTAFRPTPSIGRCQNTIDFINKTNEQLIIPGRHDVIFAIKGIHVINALTNYALCEMLFEEHIWKN
ncbi:MAG TPA: chorismate synthase [Bacilli bacterium]|nr:chorismate synthase [Bacilli bacterium]